MHPSISPRALSERVAEAIQFQDIRLRGGAAHDPRRDLRLSLSDLQDVLARALPMAAEVMSRPDYERLAVEIGGVTFAAMHEDADEAGLLDVRRRVATATIKLAVVVTLAGS